MLKLLCCTLGLTVATSTAHAEDLLQIFNLAQANDPEIMEARATYNANHTLVDQRRSSLLPALNASASNSRDTLAVQTYFDSYPSKVYSLSLQQALVNFESWYKFDAARKQDAAEAIRLMQAEQQLIMKVAKAYFDVLGSQENLQTYQAEQAASVKVFEQTQQRFKVGLIGITDVYDSQTSADTARVKTLLEQNTYKKRLEVLEAITGRIYARVAGLQSGFPIAPINPSSMEAWEQLARTENPAVKQAELELASKQQDAKAAAAALYPTLDLSASYNISESGRASYSAIPTGVIDTSGVKLSFTMPLTSGGLGSARKRQAYYARDASEAKLLKSRRDNVQNIRNAYRSVETDVEEVEARAQTVSSAQSALAATELGVEAGTRNVVDVVLAQRALYQAKRDHATARFAYVMDILVLKQAAGVLTPQDVIDLNAWLQN